MKVLCNREKLREAFSLVGNVIPSKSTKPVLQSIRLEAKKGKVELSATDLEVGVRYQLEETQVEKEGVIVLPAKAGDFIRDLADDSVTLIAEGTNCKIQGLSDHCSLVGQSAEEFPRIPEFEEKNAIRISAADFSDMAKKTAFAAAKEMGRYAMNGILLEVESSAARMIATDGRRLALCERGIEKGPKTLTAAIVPTKGMQQFLRSLDASQEEVQITIASNQMAIRSGNAQVFVRLLEGEFPKYSAVIPKEAPHSAEIDRTKLQQKLQLVANLTAEESRSVRWSFTADTVQLRAESAGRGEAKAELEAKVKAKGATGLQISFNPDYLLEGLKSSDAETVRLDFADKDKPGKFSLGENHVYVVMPVTLD